MQISCKRELNCQTQQLCTVATITVRRGTEREVEDRARTLPYKLISTSRRSGTLVLGFCEEISEAELTEALQHP